MVGDRDLPEAKRAKALLHLEEHTDGVGIKPRKVRQQLCKVRRQRF